MHVTRDQIRMRLSTVSTEDLHAILASTGDEYTAETYEVALDELARRGENVAALELDVNEDANGRNTVSQLRVRSSSSAVLLSRGGTGEVVGEVIEMSQPGYDKNVRVRREKKEGLSPRATRTYNEGDITTLYTMITVTSSSESWLSCARCNREVIYEPCRNCLHYPQHHDLYGSDSVDPCAKCRLPHHQRRWICEGCGCNNPLTLHHYETITAEDRRGPLWPYLIAFPVTVAIGLWALNGSLRAEGCFMHWLLGIVSVLCGLSGLFGVITVLRMLSR